MINNFLLNDCAGVPGLVNDTSQYIAESNVEGGIPRSMASDLLEPAAIGHAGSDYSQIVAPSHEIEAEATAGGDVQNAAAAVFTVSLMQ